MPTLMKDMGDALVVNESEVGRSAKHPNRIEDIQLVRFYLNIERDIRIPPTGNFDRTGFDGMSEEPALPNRIVQFQLKQNSAVKGHGFVIADGKVSVPKSSSDGSIGYGSGTNHGLYTIRQMARRWDMYKVIHNVPDDFRISAHPLCPPMLAAQLIPLGR